MISSSKAFGLMGLAIFVAGLAAGEAYARGGGGSNVMNSPGYQRRLQESRGQVTTQSSSQPYTIPPSTYPGHAWRQRGTR